MVKRVLLVLNLVKSRNSDKVLNSVPILHTPSSIPPPMSQRCSPLPVCVPLIVYTDQKPREGKHFPLRTSMPNLKGRFWLVEPRSLLTPQLTLGAGRMGSVGWGLASVSNWVLVPVGVDRQQRVQAGDS